MPFLCCRDKNCGQRWLIEQDAQVSNITSWGKYGLTHSKQKCEHMLKSNVSIKPWTTSLIKCCLNCTTFYSAFLRTCFSIYEFVCVCVSVCLRVRTVCLFILWFMTAHYQRAAGVFPDACIFQSSLRFTVNKYHHPTTIPCAFYCLPYVIHMLFASLTPSMLLTLTTSACWQETHQQCLYIGRKSMIHYSIQDTIAKYQKP